MFNFDKNILEWIQSLITFCCILMRRKSWMKKKMANEQKNDTLTQQMIK